MLNSSTVRILDFDGSVTKQRGLLEKYKASTVDLKDVSARARFWSDRETSEIIKKRIAHSPKNSVTFTGSGDFHHVSDILIGEFDEPISVIDFDFHPDWDILPPRMGCGSWVTRVLDRVNIVKLVLLGVSSEDISSFLIHTANLGSLENNRLEIYPYSHKPTSLFFRKVPENMSVKVKKGFLRTTLYWDELKKKDLGQFFLSLAERMPVKKTYITIDKDCLKKEAALTNWEEGMLSLDELCLGLGILKRNLDIIGVDITGDYSPIALNGTVKKLVSYFDHPKNVKAALYPESYVTAVNERTNLEILETLLG